MDINNLQRRFLALVQRIADELTGIRQANEHQAQSAREQQQSSEKQWNPQADVRAILNTLQAIERQQNAPQKNQNDYQRRNFYVQLAGVLILFAYTTFTFLQAWTLTYQTQILASQSIDSVAQAINEERNTRAQLDLLRQQVVAAQNGTKAIDRQVRDENRPWITITKEASQNFTLGSKVFLTLDISNTGKSPAVNPYAIFMIDKVKNNQSIRKFFIKPPPNGMSGVRWNDSLGKRPHVREYAGIIFPIPDDKIKVPAVWMKRIEQTTPKSPWAEIATISQTDAAELSSGSAFFIIHGIVAYTDVFGIDHWTQYCDWFAANGVTNVTGGECTQYNQTDHNE